MNQEKNSKATTNLSRQVEYFVFQNPGLSALCPDGVTLPPEEKNKETRASLFFSRRQRSKVIFRVTRNYLALPGSSLFHPLPVVAGLRSQRTTFFLMRPMVAFRGCPGQACRETGVVGTTSRWSLSATTFQWKQIFPQLFPVSKTLKHRCYGK